MKKILSAACCAAIVLAASSAQADGELWIVDFEKAKAAAKEQNKDILMDFTGSDWCHFCIELDKNVFATEDFKSQVPNHYILLKLDSPRDKSNQPEAEQKQVAQMVSDYKVEGYPTIIMADAQGRPYAKLVGYGGTPADKYVADLVDKQNIRQQRDTLLAQADAAEGVEKAKLLDQALAVLDDEALAVSTYRNVVDQIVELDGGDDAGLKSKYSGIIRLAEFRSKLQKVQQEIQPGNFEAALKQVEALVTELAPQGEALQEGLYLQAMLHYQMGNKAKSKDTLLAAQKAAAESQLAARIDLILQQAFQDEDSTDEGDKKAEQKDDK